MELDFRKLARQWRSSNKARAAKLGLTVELPTINEVEAHLRCQPLTCTYCGRTLNASKAGRMNLDHRIPLNRGGTPAVHNIVLSCSPDNRAKGNCTETEFRALRQLVSTWEDGGRDLFRRLKLGWFSHS